MKKAIHSLSPVRAAALLAAACAVGAILFVSVSPARESPRLAPHAARRVQVKRPPRVAIPVPVANPAVASPAADQRFVVKRILRIDKPFRHGDYAWDDKGVPPGPIVITVDLAAETLSVFRGGYEIGAAVILFGDDGMATPLGTFPITQKDADHVSNLYDAPMPYMLRLTNDGVSIHGSEVEGGAVTHGCIGVPVKFARLLFQQAHLGDRVIITRGKTMTLGDAIVRG